MPASRLLTLKQEIVYFTILIMQFRDLLGILAFERNLKVSLVQSGKSRNPGTWKLGQRVQVQAIQHQAQCIDDSGCADQDGHRGAG